MNNEYKHKRFNTNTDIIIIMSFEYELTNKRRTLLWLYQVVPNIDIIKYIYELKSSLELADTLYYYGIIPHITIIPESNYLYKINNIWQTKILNTSALYMQMVTTPGLICNFTQAVTLTSQEEELLNNGFWDFYATEIDESPTLKDKINCINKILEEAPYFTEDIYYKLKNIYEIFNSFNDLDAIDFVRIGIDVKGDWHIPSIYF
jgi:hypothetical protein